MPSRTGTTTRVEDDRDRERLRLPVLRRALLTGRRLERGAPELHRGMLQAERLWKWSPCTTTSPATSCGPGSTTWARAPGPSRGSRSGAMDITGHPKDAYYLYQSLWTERPVLRLFPHWNWPRREGQTIPVLAYTNCNIVELFLNGRSLGEKRLEFPRAGERPAAGTPTPSPVVNPTTTDLHLSWDVPYEPGVLRAVGKRDGKDVRDGRGAHRGRAGDAPADRRPRHDRRRAGRRGAREGGGPRRERHPRTRRGYAGALRRRRRPPRGDGQRQPARSHAVRIGRATRVPRTRAGDSSARTDPAGYESRRVRTVCAVRRSRSWRDVARRRRRCVEASAVTQARGSLSVNVEPAPMVLAAVSSPPM